MNKKLEKLKEEFETCAADEMGGFADRYVDGLELELKKKEKENKIFQELYDNEINVHISSFWDSGFTVKLGDLSNGFKDETSVYGWDGVTKWLDKAVKLHYPDSDYAKKNR